MSGLLNFHARISHDRAAESGSTAGLIELSGLGVHGFASELSTLL